MALFVVRTKDKAEVRQWFDETRERSKENNFIKNPFKWKLKMIKQGRDLLIVCDVQPLIFNFTIFGWVTAFVVFFLWGANWIVWSSVIVGMGTYFWTSAFFYQMTKLALRRKAKYSGPLKRVKLAELIKRVVL